MTFKRLEWGKMGKAGDSRLARATEMNAAIAQTPHLSSAAMIIASWEESRLGSLLDCFEREKKGKGQ